MLVENAGRDFSVQLCCHPLEFVPLLLHSPQPLPPPPQQPLPRRPPLTQHTMDSLRIHDVPLEGKWALAATVGAGVVWWLFSSRRGDGLASAPSDDDGVPESRVRALAHDLEVRERRTGNTPPRLTHPSQGRETSTPPRS